MRNISEIFGKSVQLTYRQGLQQLELAISEGLLLPEAELLAPVTANLFGRPSLMSGEQDLSFLAGLASTGLRTAAFCQPESLEQHLPALRKLTEHLLPVVIHTTAGNGSVFEPEGFFRFFAATPQESVDLAIIAHKVAELALLPGIIVSAAGEGEVMMPTVEQLRTFLGNPDDLLASPTPAQQIVFGKNRRRIPNRYNYDFPALSGMHKEGWEQMNDLAARRRYFYQHLPEVLESVLQDFAELTGRRYTFVGEYESAKADYVVVTRGSEVPALQTAVDKLRSREKARFGYLNLRVAAPFPASALSALLAGKKKVTLLESVAEGGSINDSSLQREMEIALSKLGKKAPVLLAGFSSGSLSPEAAEAVFRNMMRDGAGKSPFFIDIEFSRRQPGSPQQEVLLQAISRAYPAIEEVTLYREGPDTAAGATNSSNPIVQDLPAAIRRFQDQGPPYTRLSRFYHDTAFFYSKRRKEELVADPFQALDLVPAATAPLADLSGRRASLPVFQPGNCTGCGQCVVHCPHVALPPVVLGLESLIRGAMNIANRQGRPVSQLTPMVKNLARSAATAIGNVSEPVTKAADFLEEAFAKVAGAMHLPEEKLTTLRQEWDTILEVIGNFPVAVTQTHFQEGERRAKGAGELFSLAVDLSACTGCGVCAAVCEEDALIMQPQEQTLVDQLQQTFHQWEELPDTSADTINRLTHDPEYDPLAAVMLSRNYYLSMAGGSLSEEGASAKAVLHLLTTLTESVIQPRIVRHARKINELIDQLSENIHAKLSDALPRDNFRSLLESVGEAGGARLPLDEVVSRLASREHLQLVDTHSLQRKIELVNDLKDMHWALMSGPTGTGRARYGLVLAGQGWPWANTYPFNIFLAPALLQSAPWSGELLAGLFQGQLRHLIDNIKLLRRAKLEAKDKYRPEIHDQQIAALRWEDLDKEEKALVPPLLLVADTRTFSELPSAQIQRILATPWPVKLTVLDDGKLPVSGKPETTLFQGYTATLATVTQGTAYVLQASTARPHALFSGLREGLDRTGPALFHLLAPEITGNGNHTWPQLATLALDSRAFPVFTFDPQQDRGFLSGAFNLDGNPEPETDWTAFDEEGVLTFADWLRIQPEWADHFQALAPGEGATMDLTAFLALDPEQRKGKIPVLSRRDTEGEVRQWQVSPQVVAASQAAGRRWRILREMAGRFSPFPEKLKEKVENEMQERHEMEISRLRQDYEEKLQQQEQKLMQEVKIRLREKLLSLSQKKN